MRKYGLFSFVLFILMINQNLAQTVTTYAGSSMGSDPTGGIAKSSVHFNQPYGIAMDKNNNIWISDMSNHCIRMIYNSDQKIYIRVGYTAGYTNATGITAQFDSPRGLAIGPNNEIYVADNGNNCIRKISAFGSVGSAQSVTTYAGNANYGHNDGAASQAEFASPNDVAVDASGNVYVADAGNNVIRKISAAGIVSTLGSASTIGGYQDGSVTIAKFNYPTGVFVTSTGDIYVADKMNQKIRKISGGIVSTVVSGAPLVSPDDVVVAANGNLYITDQHKIVKLSGGTPSVFAGSTTLNESGLANGEGNAALFFNVKCMMLRASDNSLFVADMDNHLIRNITIPAATNPPKCSFTSDKTTVSKTKTVTFTDQSTPTPTSWKWTFTGGTPSTSTIANPVVTYATAGIYPVKLVVSNADGSDSLTKSAYITVIAGINDDGNSGIKVYPSPATDVLYLNPGNIDFGNATITITSLNGKYSEVVENSIQKNEVISIPVRDLQSGIYLLTISTAKDLYRFRFIKQ